MNDKDTIASLQARKNTIIGYLETKLDIARGAGRDIAAKSNRILPNIPVLEVDDYGRFSTDFDDWLDNMQTFLFGDGDVGATRIAYVESRLGNRLSERVGNKYTTAEEILDASSKIYSNTNRKQAAINKYEELFQKEGAPFIPFFHEFNRLATELGFDGS
ncbi:hypothetical protein OCU04_003000 [Sclerotinia nivalis]|uniref:Uncharacterized protein n=1 Tax=Sclerotinia nivalis TaxID=352851 RepID=A0A9X0DP50_9HELO|nr:hypothetical protein OCU04_003000 [Sclerotinia nivalis]